MKKSIFLGLATFAMLLTTSCVNEIAPSKEIGDTPVTFQIGTPEIATRAYSDGTTATKLQYAVYDEDDNLLDALTVEDAKINGSTSIELQLVTGNEYSIIFWAAAPNAPYTIDFAQKTMTVNYEGAICNDETRDAFYKCHTFTVRGAQTETIELKRPFAQLNIGTNDYEASEKAGYKPAYSYVKVPVSSVLNLFDGTVNDPVAVEFALSAIPTEEEFPVRGYEYISMNYLLVSADKEVVDVTFGYSENIQTVENTRIVGSVPVQRNYRTNIYGQLLTSDIDINVEIDPEYEGELPETMEEKLKIAAQVGGEVTLTEDVELSNPLVISGLRTRASVIPIVMEIDLNGYTLSYTSDVAKHSAMITINEGNKFIVKDSKGNGKISYNYTGAGDPNFGWGTYTLSNYGGTLVIESGTVEMNCNLNANESKHMYCALWQYSGSTLINDGKISTPTYRSARLWKGDMTINDGIFEGQLWVQAVDNSAVLTINGGSFAPRGIDGSSVFIENRTYDVVLKVTDGSFETKLACNDSTKKGVKGTIFGGVYGVEIDENLIAEGYCLIESDGKYYVVPDGTSFITTADELVELCKNGGRGILKNDIILDKESYSDDSKSRGGIVIEADKEVFLDMRGKTIKATNPNLVVVFYTKKGSTLTIDGNGCIDCNEPGTHMFAPFGDMIIENGTFRKTIPADGTPVEDIGGLFIGTGVNPKGSQSVTINGGYFDSGYYDANAADIDDYLAGTKTFVETDDDIAKRGNSGDKNAVRVALKNNVNFTLNLSKNLLKVYGGTFVGMNPAWGDEGCMLPTTPNYLRPSSNNQGAFLDGQEFNPNGLEIPTGYAITKGSTTDGRPTYTVTYNK